MLLWCGWFSVCHVNQCNVAIFYRGSILGWRVLSACDLSLIFRLRPLSAYSGQAFYPKLAHFYPRRPVEFWQNSLAFIRILPQGLQWTFRGPDPVLQA